MIEVVYKQEKKEAVGNDEFFNIPKNIRQIGEVSENHKIYIEDYAHTYLSRITEDVSDGKMALLLGGSNWSKGVTYIFIKSALTIEGVEVSAEHLDLSEGVWRKTEEAMQQYFPDQEPVGWFFAMPQYPLQITDAIYRTHLNYFAGNEKVLFMMEPSEKEEAFYRYENGHMSRQKGYYIYFEKNECMQEYMIEQNHNQPMESKEAVQDRAVHDFRKIILEKTEAKERGKTPLLMYGASACLILTLLAAGISYMGDYQKLKKLPDEVSQAAAATGELFREKDKYEEGNGEGNGEDAAKEEAADKDEDAQSLRKEGGDFKEGSVSEKDSGFSQAESRGKTDGEKSIVSSKTASERYVVQIGDTLNKISQEHYGSLYPVKKICQLNGIHVEDFIYPGQIILLP